MAPTTRRWATRSPKGHNKINRTISFKDHEVPRGDESPTSADGAYELWAGQHGFVFFAQYLTKKLVNDGQTSRPTELTTLFPANTVKVEAELKIRSKLETEGASGGRQIDETKIGRISTSWGRRYKRRAQKVRGGTPEF